MCWSHMHCHHQLLRKLSLGACKTIMLCCAALCRTGRRELDTACRAHCRVCANLAATVLSTIGFSLAICAPAHDEYMPGSGHW